MAMKKSIIISVFAFFIFANTSAQSQEDVISALLDEFLLKVDQKEMHNRFWDESLIYTSASGMRHGKEKIMAGFSDANGRQANTNSARYMAEEKQIRIYGETATVAFMLVSKLADGSTTTYWNSGTLHLKNGEWKVVQWQATKAAAQP
jgi:hypothetical protein